MTRYSPAAKAAGSMCSSFAFVNIVLICGIWCYLRNHVESVKCIACIAVLSIEYCALYMHYRKHWRKYDPMFRYMLPSRD